MSGLGKAVAWFPLMGGKGTEGDISSPGSAPELVTSPLPAWVQRDNDAYVPRPFPMRAGRVLLAGCCTPLPDTREEGEEGGKEGGGLGGLNCTTTVKTPS